MVCGGRVQGLVEVAQLLESFLGHQAVHWLEILFRVGTRVHAWCGGVPSVVPVTTPHPSASVVPT